jgi:hypothetical protein
MDRGAVQLSDRTYLSFQGACLDLQCGTRSRSFKLGEGFASIRPSSISLVTDYFTEAVEPVQGEGNPKVVGKPIAEYHCAVCEGAIHGTQHSLTLAGTRIHLCCSNCSEIFLRVRQIVRNFDAESKRMDFEPT